MTQQQIDLLKSAVATLRQAQLLGDWESYRQFEGFMLPIEEAIDEAEGEGGA